ncbi:glycoside hydrolase family 19 protein [Chitinophaga nivalis]|uniref:Carbohydrate-binding protein n=1 Tax=Chitinophaga nivalis TaxID=2991709 RepID=A0ABT3ILX3_9BACT|nr:glycoside hydrolase family 19 protein [Chitinophaga nivalis]MCW3465336.1 carbohydrate-binding protein [Chitinophaga nivalis]MCW3484972.1 carbohydrate-binding protein [Chitinophaga nivalis]
MKIQTRYLNVALILCLLISPLLPAVSAYAGNKSTAHLISAHAYRGQGADSLITAAEWDAIFPHRFNPDDRTGAGTLPTTAAKDFYSQANFVEAVRRMSNIKAILERRCGTNYYRVTRIDKTTGAQVVIRNDAGFNESTWSNRAIVTETLDYGTFVNEGDLIARKRELVAFLANISQETTGGWPTAPGGQYAWGLYFREEQGYEGTSNIGYRDETSTLYPPAPGKSYHGRGPIQLSYNYNYGQASEFLYGDKNILLAAPEKVIQDGAIAFETAIWFWMTPQYPKPSCHDVMVPGKWTPTAAETAAGLKPGFGATVNIINGGLECGGASENTKVLNRIAHYQRYATIKQVSLELNGGNNAGNCGCANMGRFTIDNGECSSITAISFTQPVNGLITTTSLTPVTFTVTKNDPRREITSLYLTINGQRFNDSTAQWTPPAYQQYVATATASRTKGDTLRTSLTFAVWNNVTFEGCKNLPAWQANKDYTAAGNVVLYNNNIYRNKWWAGSTAVPGSSDIWELLGACTNGPRPDSGCGGIAAWLSTKAYSTNEQAVFKNKIYKAKWWTQNNQPDTNSGDGKPWTFVRDCGTTPAAAISNEAPQATGNRLFIYPNPVAGNTLNVTVKAAAGEKLIVRLLHISTLHPIVQKNVVAETKGDNLIQLDVSRVPSGTWVLQITSEYSRKPLSTMIVRQQ